VSVAPPAGDQTEEDTMNNDGTAEISPSTARPSKRPPWTVTVPVVIAYVIGVGALWGAYDRIMAAVDWEHRYRASYIREHGAAFSSPGSLFTSAAIAFVLGVLLIWGANRASKGVTNVILIVALLGTGAGLVLTDLWRGWGVVEVLVGMALPTLMLALLLQTRSSRAYFRAGAR
jgi:hypothetical protein